jgi:uncharacterized MAPEG superfamily protein
MTTPVWVLLLFVFWTILVLIGSIGIYRLGRVFTGRARARDYAFPDLDPGEWHRRAIRAHLNCVENLPIFAAIVLAIVASGLKSATLDRLALVFLVARVLHTIVHLGFRQRGRVTIWRFAFYTIQLGCMLGMGIYVVLHA